MEAGETITFPREGDRNPGTIPADIVFNIKHLSHAHFERAGLGGADLRHTAHISLKEVNNKKKLNPHVMFKFILFFQYIIRLCVDWPW